MKQKLNILFATCILAAAAHAQNWTTVTASNITDLNQNKLAAGQLCFLGTDQNDTPISFGVGGGGQVLKRAFCSAVANGAVAAFTVPNPASTQPAGVYYRVTVKDTSTGLEVLRYTQVAFTGASFSFDNYAPLNVGSFAPLTGTSVSGNLSVSGNATVTGSLAAGSFSPTVVTSGQFTSNTANPAGSGIVRLASGDCVRFRNNANTADVNGVCKNASDQVTVGNGPFVVPSVADQSVGRATADTLSNKILTGAGSGNSVTLLNEQGPTAALTGNSTDQTVYTYTLPANTLGAGKCLVVRTWFNHTSGTASVTWKLFWGGAVYLGDSATLAGTFYFEATICNNTGVTNAQHGSVSTNVNNIVSVGGNGMMNVFSPLAASVDATQAQIISLTFNVASTDQAKGGEFIIELVQ